MKKKRDRMHHDGVVLLDFSSTSSFSSSLGSSSDFPLPPWLPINNEIFAGEKTKCQEENEKPGCQARWLQQWSRPLCRELCPPILLHLRVFVALLVSRHLLVILFSLGLLITGLTSVWWWWGARGGKFSKCRSCHLGKIHSLKIEMQRTGLFTGSK